MGNALLMRRGFTMFELMIALAVVGVLVALAAPSFKTTIQMQRLRGVNAQLITDMQFARSEAVTRGRVVRVNFGADATQTCYVLYYSDTSALRCDCLLGAGSACPAGGNREEIRTVNLPRSNGVSLTWPMAQESAFGYSNVTGGLVAIPLDTSVVPPPSIEVDTRIDDDRRLHNSIPPTGRPTVCAPNAQVMQVTGC